MKKFIIVGNGGRESAFAQQLIKDSVVSAVMTHDNPTIARAVRQSGGNYILGDVNNGQLVTDFSKQQKADYVFVNADNPLQAGVVDTLLAAGINAIGPTREGARIEWDKIYAMKVMARLFPEMTPFFRVITAPNDIPAAQQAFTATDKAIVVKPQGLTGGKGVKVMGEHLADATAAANYTAQLLAAGEPVLWVEKLHGIEFTVMGLTDGNTLIAAPATYDYPYRYAGDTGLGTGGMGCFSDTDGRLPFLSATNIATCETIMRAVITDMREHGQHFNGVLNGGFFLTSNGIKFMEFNARFGDPEAINVLSVLESSFANLLQAMAAQTLETATVNFAPQASVVKYLVAPSYPEKGERVTFRLPLAALEEQGLSVQFSSAVAVNENTYQTVSSSRVAAISGVADNIVQASERINAALDTCFDGSLDYRADIATNVNLKALEQQAAYLQSS